MTPFDTVKAHALAIAEREQHRRATAEKKDKPLTATWFDAASLPSSPPGKSALRAWAELAAPLVTYEEWAAIAWHCADTVKPFDGDLVSFFETAFEGLTLRDGGRMWA
jgi:hypothetical protein